MKKLFSLILVFTVLSVTAQERIIKGKITDGKLPLENVKISITGKDTATITNADGGYEIAADTGDVLQYSYIGMRTITIQVEDVTRFLNIAMLPEITELEEVIVEGSLRKSQSRLEEEYPYNNRIIRTAFQYLDADRTPGFIQFLNEDEINPIGICILDALRSQFAGVRVVGNCAGGGDVFLRSTGSLTSATPAIYDVDGIIFTDAPIWLNIGNIKRIALLRNIGQTLLYGNIASGGVIVVNTVAGNPRLAQMVDRARLRNNYATEKALKPSEILKNESTYLKELEASASFAQAKGVFEHFESNFSNAPYFYLDAYQYFSNRWNAVDYADAIIMANYGQFESNAVLLKALAYTYESQERLEMAHNIYKEAFILRPNYAQSYLDMANSYRNLDEHQQAAAIYTRYEYLIENGMMKKDTVHFGPIINREFNNLLTLEGESVVNNQKVEKLYVAEEDFRGTRLVFEWNDGEAEFELQFVNPENRYYKWKHSLADNAEEIVREKKFGHNINEYLLDGSLPGTWRINVRYLGNKSLSPTYLKATVYYDYGSLRQRKETQVFKLSLKNVNQELFTVQSIGTIAKE